MANAREEITKDDVQDRLLKILYEEPCLVLALKEKYVTDEIWKICIEREPSLFKQMKHPSEDVCYYAVGIDGYNLKYVRSKFNYVKMTDKLIYMAVTSCPKSILFVPEKMISTGLKEMAFDRDPALMLNYDDVRPEYIKRKVEEDSRFLKYLPNADEDLVCEALIKDPNLIVYYSEPTEKMKQILETYHPAVYALYSQI